MDGAVAGDELETGDLGGEGRPAASGAVRPRDEGTCDGLPVDVAHVVQREPESFEGGVEQVKRGAAQDGHRHRHAVDVDHPDEPVGAQQPPVGHRDIGEGVAGAHHLQPDPLTCRVGHEPGHLVGGSRGEHAGR